VFTFLTTTVDDASANQRAKPVSIRVALLIGGKERA
jgi:hypothetical protein